MESAKINTLFSIISKPRSETYLNYFRDEMDITSKSIQAYELYIWNIKISAAFLEVISLYEIALRNAIIKALEPSYRVYSILNDNFIRALKPTTREELVSVVNKLSRDKQYEIVFQNNRLQPLRIDTNAVPPGKVIAELNLIFWENMLSNTHRIRWINYYDRAFPCLKASCLSELNSFIDNIRSTTNRTRDLRNRICHHEPIFNENKTDLGKIFSEVKTVLGYISTDTIHILNEFERISQLLTLKPKR